MDRETRRRVILIPLAMWGGLLVLLLVSALYAHFSGAPARSWVNLAIAVGMWLIISLVLMQLRKSPALVRLAAMAGLIWASFLFILTFADLLTR